MKIPCEIIVSHVLPVAKGAIAKELVMTHGMTQVQVAKLFGVTSAAVSQYLKGVRECDSVIDRSAYKEDFHQLIRELAVDIVNGLEVMEALCIVCSYAFESGLIKALYVFEGYSADEIGFMDEPIVLPSENDTNELRLRQLFFGGWKVPAAAQWSHGCHQQVCRRVRAYYYRYWKRAVLPHCGEPIHRR